MYRAQQWSLALSFGAVVAAWHLALSGRPDGMRLDERRALLRRFAHLLDADLANVAAGRYGPGLLFQMPYVTYARLAPRLALEAPRIVLRRRRQGWDELPPSIDRSRLPRYYTRNFHWQRDGWLSDRSARSYDASVEVLFGGTADVMRRLMIPHVLDGLPAPTARVLDLACGTGRLLYQLRRVAPQLELHGVDLSPYYLARARSLVPTAKLSCHNVEALSFPDRSFDAVTTSFLFHELPLRARRRVLEESRRVLRPGGRLVILDSMQLVDAGDLASLLDQFPRLYHEPYYRSYIRRDLARLVSDAGLVPIAHSTCFVSKLLVAARPPTPGSPGPGGPGGR